MGHDLRLCAGEVDALRYQARLVPPMHFTWPPAARATAAAFDPDSDPVAVRAEIDRLAELLMPVLRDWVRVNELDVMIVENAWAIPMHLPLGLALRRLVEETGLPAIGHHHDYWWERERFAQCVVPEVLDAAFPPDLPSIRHVSINSIAGGELKRRRGISSTVVPNVFDFDQPRPRRHPARAAPAPTASSAWARRACSSCSRRASCRARASSWRSSSSDASRIPTRSCSSPRRRATRASTTSSQLERLAEKHHVRLAYAADRFAPDHEGKPLRPAHSLHDAYLAADLITYPSLYEGFGNALLEALFYGVPVVVNRYPVYVADIAPLGLKLIEIDGAITDKTVAEVRAVLANPDRQRAWARHNFEIAHKHLSYRVLRRKLGALLRDVGVG